MATTWLGPRLVKLRKDHNMTQSELGAILGVSMHAVSKWENGINDMTSQQVYVICTHFGISADWLLGLAGFNDDLEGIRQT